MIKFKISGERFADACSLPDYLGVIAGRMGNQIRVLPAMVVAVGKHEIKDKDGNILKTVQDGEYIVEIVTDSEGDIVERRYIDEANALMDKAEITPRRFTKLCAELTEAARNIVNPPSGEDSDKPSPQPEQKDRAT